MRRFLERIGAAPTVLVLIDEVCDTCKVCRMWVKPGPANVCSIDLPDTFNVQVECALLFVYSFIIFHLLDRCTRWHAAKVIENKLEDTLIAALDEIWVGVHGAMKELIIDGEGGLVQSLAANAYLRRQTIKLSLIHI